MGSSGLACSAAWAGAVRYNTGGYMEFCHAGAWKRMGIDDLRLQARCFRKGVRESEITVRLNQGWSPLLWTGERDQRMFCQFQLTTD
jgi:hypothetical protein